MSSQKTSFHSLEKKRLLCIALFIFFLFIIILLQFFRLQVIEGDKWTARAMRQHQKVIVEPFMRGRFFSNNAIKGGQNSIDQPFAIDIPKFHLYIDPLVLPEEQKQIIASELFEFFAFDLKTKEKILENFYKESHSRKIISWLDQNTSEKVQKWWHGYAKREKIPSNALYFVKDYLRSYPFGSLLGQLLHTVQEDKDPHTFQSLPTGGLEMYFNKYLKGKKGKRVILRSPRHPLDIGKVIETPENGADVYLTINHYLQAIMEKELEKGVKEAKAKGGWAVMLDPFTGDVLALAQYPFFDLSNYRKYFNDPNLQEHTRVKTVCDAYEPGSVMKATIFALALKANEELRARGEKPLFIPQEKIATSNGKIPGHRKPLKDGSRVHKYLNMYMGIQKSSNVYVSKIVQKIIERMGENWYRQNLIKVYSFGQKTGIEIPAESPGMVPVPGKLHPNGRPEWSSATPYMIAIGHNMLFTSLQLAKAFAIISNGGFDIKPTILRKISKNGPNGEEIIFDNSKTPRLGERLLSQEVCSELIKGLKFVTKSGGTSPSADIKGYTEAGKSGTSEKIEGGTYSTTKYLSSFIGFTPVNKPRFVLLVSLDEPATGYKPGLGKAHHGGVCAAPIFQRIATEALHYLGVAPDDPLSYPGSAITQGDGRDWQKEVKTLKELYQSWNQQ